MDEHVNKRQRLNEYYCGPTIYDSFTTIQGTLGLNVNGSHDSFGFDHNQSQQGQPSNVSDLSVPPYFDERWLPTHAFPTNLSLFDDNSTIISDESDPQYSLNYESNNPTETSVFGGHEYNQNYNLGHVINGFAEEASSRTTTEICFGMLSDIPITTSGSALLNCDTTIINLTYKKPGTVLKAGCPSVFGQLDNRSSALLVNLSSDEGITFQLYAKISNRRAATKKHSIRKTGANELQYAINVIIYGPEEICSATGEYLEMCGIYLQDPIECDREVVYRNPHLLTKPVVDVLTSSLTTWTSLSQAQVEQINLSEDLFSQLSADNHLSLTEAPECIATTLYPHQKKALTFMIRREQGWLHDGSEDDLWAKELDDNGQVTYTNMITERSQREQPLDTKGGLLADQMGLGKSLSMIALIGLRPCKIQEPIIFTTDGSFRRLKATLIVVPYSLLEVWDTQLQRHLAPKTLSWTRMHGSKKRKTPNFAQYDIVITTFETLVSEQKKHRDPKHKKHSKDTVFSFFWHRIVLDEAHTIRNRTTAIAGAACAIQATSRWAITGTPIQNRVTDFSSLLEFLKVYPFSDPKIFDSEITKPWLKSAERDASRLKTLVRCISLCRSKKVIDLPPRTDLIIPLEFSTSERSRYDQTKEGTIKKFNEALSSNPLQPGQYLNALQWLNELRLICNHGIFHERRSPNKPAVTDLMPGNVWNKLRANKAFQEIVSAGEAACSVCDNPLIANSFSDPSVDSTKPTLSECLTITCGSCVKDCLDSKARVFCSHNPACKSVEVTWVADSVGPKVSRNLPDIPSEQVSTKLRALLNDLKSSADGEKSVVFSYWTYTLDLVESLLLKSSIAYVRIDGQQSGEKREEAIQKFQNDSSVKVILVSITCGGAGLDLTAASVAYILEPQWNPMMEEQALSRIHRLGQRKEVRTIRYRVRNSFEEKVVATQRLKKEIAAEAFSIDGRKGPLDSSTRLEYLRDQIT